MDFEWPEFLQIMTMNLAKVISALCVFVWVITKATCAGMQNRQSTLNGLTRIGGPNNNQDQ